MCVIPPGTCGFRCLAQFILAGAVYNHQLTGCATRACRACVDFPVCVAVCYLTLRTGCEKHGRKILYRTPFRSGHMSAICARLGSKGKVGVQRGRKTAGCPSFLPPAAGAATLPPSADGESPAEVQRKTSRPLGANTLTQFACPAGSVQKRSRPLGRPR